MNRCKCTSEEGAKITTLEMRANTSPARSFAWEKNFSKTLFLPVSWYLVCCFSWEEEEDLPVPSNKTAAAAFRRVCARKYLSEVFKAGAALLVFNFSSEKSAGWAADDLSMSVVRWKHFQMAFWLYLCLLAENAFDIFFRWGLFFFFFISACLRKGIYWLKVTALTALEIEVPFLSTEQVQHVQKQHKRRLLMCLSSALGLATWREEGISCSSRLCEVVSLLRWRTLPLNRGWEPWLMGLSVQQEQGWKPLGRFAKKV